MLRKANQKRALDNLVIQKGEFTTDFFRKTNWKDWLGEDGVPKGDEMDEGEDGKEEGKEDGDDFFGTLDKYGAVLDKVEDEADVVALKKASKEIEQDGHEEDVIEIVEEVKAKVYTGGVEAYMFRYQIREWEWENSVIKVEEMFEGVEL
jgi:helicase SWR1